MLSPAEQACVLEQWNATEAAYPQDRCVHELIAEQAERTPDVVAVDYEDQTLTYRHLDERANQLAHYLRTLGVGPEKIVGLCLSRSLDLVVGLLGILKAGGAYLPVDWDYPPERVAFMLRDAGVSVLVSSTQTLGAGETSILPAGVVAVRLDADWPRIAQQPASAPVTGLKPQQLAYCIYTSGSTGQPKGVMNIHRALLNRLDWMQRTYGLTASDRVLQKTPFTFDVSVWEFLWPLMYGARLVVARPEGHRDAVYLIELIRRASISTLHFVPSMLESFLTTAGVEACSSIRRVICSGEALAASLRQRFYEKMHGELHNLYGPTEAAIDVTHWACSREEHDHYVPIGRPISNIRVYVLDGDLNAVPVGVSGELYLGGVGLARGYLSRPGLTAQRFVADPFRWGQRLYRTGDVARWRAQGMLEYLGRSDHQVKLRGFRIELGEVEAALRSHLQVREAVVLAREDSPGDKRLVAYVVPTWAGENPAHDIISAPRLRTYVQGLLPDYMVPAAIVLLDSLPLSTNGKVDRKALMAPDWSQQQSRGYVAPRTPTEQSLAQIWGEVLHLERVGSEDDFFDLGGHSLLANQVMVRVQEHFAVSLPLRVLFDAPTIRAMAKCIEQQSGQPAQACGPALVPQPRSADIPLSYAQERLWFLEKLQGFGGAGAYNISRALRVNGALNEQALGRSICELVRRHESLRTRISTSAQGLAIQIIDSPTDFDLQVVDLSGLGSTEGIREARRFAQIHSEEPFDLTRKLFRAVLLRLQPAEHVLLLAMHHIISDGWSMEVLQRELEAIYAALAADRASLLAALPVQYADYAIWQRQYLQGTVLERQLAYWRTQLAGMPPVLELPTDRPRPAMQSFRGSCHDFSVAGEVHSRLQWLARQQGVTLYMVLLAAFQVVLSRWSGQQDIAVGTPIAARTRRQMEGVIGFFANTLVIRGDLSGSPSFGELLGRVKDTVLGAFAHQELPFEKLVAQMKLPRDLSRQALFQVMFNLQNRSRTSPELKWLPLPIDSRTSKFDLSIDVIENEGGLSGRAEYAIDLFDGRTIERLIDSYRRVLAEVALDAHRRIGELPLLSPAEQACVLEQWNATEAAYPQDRCVHELIAEQAERTPDAVAVDYEDQTLTYRHLDERANQLAHYLRTLGVGPEKIVGLCLPRSLDLVVGLLGILKAGGAYLPVDWDYPPERVAFMLRDAGVSVLVSSTQTLGAGETSLLPAGVVAVRLDADWPRIAQQPASAPVTGLKPQQLAYCIYTSGSTGQPKGVMNIHRALLNRLDWMQRTYGLTASDRVLQKTPFTFDVSVWEFLWPLMYGARLVVARPEGHRDAVYLIELIRRASISTLHFVPSMLESFLTTAGVEACSSIRRVICSGEALAASLRQRFYEKMHGELHNLYGPTEAAIDVTHWACSREEHDHYVPIGRPISNIRVYVLDGDLNAVPVGVSGELYLGGVGLARGYLSRPGLTAQRFVADPFRWGQRLYRTGDVARWRAQGMLEYLGRSDHQVKLRGFRIELGEVEAALRSHLQVREAVVLAREDSPGDKRLVAYVVPTWAGENPAHDIISAPRLRTYVQGLLPDYMVPAAIVLLDSLPLSTNGKVDRKALMAPDWSQQQSRGYVAPRTPTEQSLAQIWGEVLHLERVGSEDDFFDLGGHSLLANQVMVRVQEHFAVSLPLRVLFDAPTVGQFAERIGLIEWARKKPAPKKSMREIKAI